MNEQHYQFFIGIDISKRYFDVAILMDQSTTSYVFENSRKGANAFIRLLKNQKIPLPNTLMCMEHTGVYGQLLITKLVEKQAHFCVEMPIQIIRSIGVQSGKSDAVDAKRIAVYASKNSRELKLYQPMEKSWNRLKYCLRLEKSL